MKAEVVIAVRGGQGAKSRCRSRLQARQREALVEAMLHDMLQALSCCPAVHRIYVTTPTAALARLAAHSGAVVILEHGPPDLNRAFSDARRRIAASAPARVIALLPGDLPLLDSAELSACIAAAQDGAVVLAPAIADGGTGAVVQRADLPLPLAFGPGSFRKHQLAAASLGLETRVIEAPSLGFDLDRPDDLDAVAQLSHGRTAALLRGFASAGEAAA
jgi:2-phospho-L-lactate guanylyltransferase